MNKNNILAIAAVAFVSGSIFCAEQEIDATKKQLFNVVASAVAVVEKETTTIVPEVVASALEIVEETIEQATD